MKPGIISSEIGVGVGTIVGLIYQGKDLPWWVVVSAAAVACVYTLCRTYLKARQAMLKATMG